ESFRQKRHYDTIVRHMFKQLPGVLLRTELAGDAGCGTCRTALPMTASSAPCPMRRIASSAQAASPVWSSAADWSRTSRVCGATSPGPGGWGAGSPRLAGPAWLGLARDGPFHDRLVLALLAVDDNLQRFANLAAPAEIDAVDHADRSAGDSQTPADAAGEAQQRRLPVLGQRCRDIGMQMEADRERALAVAHQPVLAPQVGTAG